MRIRSCIALFYIWACASAAAAWAQPASPQTASPQTPDSLYRDRENLASARQAADLWAADLARDARSFEAAWKLARAYYWLGGHAPQPERRGFLTRGIDAGRAAASVEPNRPEGHFWAAANMGALAESSGLTTGLKYRGAIKKELETTLRLDSGFLQGSADRALGRWYFKVPRLFGGSNARAETHLRASLARAPNSTVSHFFLAEVLLDEDRTAEARDELQRVIGAPFDPDWAPEDRDYKARARALLASPRLR